jgi:hypothetical protein
MFGHKVESPLVRVRQVLALYAAQKNQKVAAAIFPHITGSCRLAIGSNIPTATS